MKTLNPWTVEQYPEQGTTNGRRVMVRSQGSIVCDVDYNTPQENIRNARLIAASPELLSALQAMVTVFNVETIDPLKAFIAIEKARGAISKATGKP